MTPASIAHDGIAVRTLCMTDQVYLQLIDGWEGSTPALRCGLHDSPNFVAFWVAGVCIILIWAVWMMDDA